jgi:hypothetical protein
MVSISHWGMFDLPANSRATEQLKSLAHPEWPYHGTPHAWPVASTAKSEHAEPSYDSQYLHGTYQRLNFGRHMP